MRINHNISSMLTQNALFGVNRDLSKTIQKLSTGLRINSAADDAAGLGVSENLRTQVRGMGQALKNTQDAMSLLNIADGALNEMAAITQRMRELVIQARNDTYTQTERLYMGREFSSLMDEIDRIAMVTNFNGIRIFATPEQEVGEPTYPNNNGSGETPHPIGDARTVFDDQADAVFGADDFASFHHFNMMIGQNYSVADQAAYNPGVAKRSWDPSAENMLTIQIGQVDSNTLFMDIPHFGWDGSDFINTGTMGDNAFGWDTAGDLEDWIMKMMIGDSVQSKFDYILDVIDGKPTFTGGTNVTGLERINRLRGHIGAMTNRLEHSVSNLMNQMAATQAAESVIRDVDFAAETTALTKNQILVQSATAMLAQSNMVPQAVRSLLG